jgi:Ser/Thr protein kinase RdoA (MazF antagonist)
VERLPLDALACEVLGRYPVNVRSIEFLRHGDAVTYKVTGRDRGAYLLRLHVPMTEAMGGHGADPVAVRSELDWLEALANDTPLILQRPVRNREGHLVTRIRVSAAAADVNATLLRWIDGEPYRRELETKETAGEIGAILATLHNHASSWQPPAGFRRPRRDGAYFRGVLAALKPAVDDERISRPHYDELAMSVDALAEALGAAPCVLHADAHKGNMLLHGGRIRLIDFSFCAVALPLFDLGVALGDMDEALHASCLDGYRRIEGLFLGSMVGAFSFWAANPKAGDLLAKHVPRVVERCAVPWNRGGSFWKL